MKIERFVLGSIETNCYVVVNEDTKECFAVDMAYCPKAYVDHIREQGYQMKALFLTHGHFDHIMGIEDFLKAFDVPVYVGREEQPLLADDRLNASSMYGYHCVYTGAKALEDGQIVECAGTEIHVIHTPGHTAGGTCYYIESDKTLMSGDTLFAGSVGRTDYPTASSAAMMESLHDKLCKLPDDTDVYPGHGEFTTIGYEKQNNPFM